MKKIIPLIGLVLTCLLLTSCPFTWGTPCLVSIEFINDSTIEYAFPFVIGKGFDTYSVNLVSITPNDGYYIKLSTYSTTKGHIYFNKDIPDGVKIKLEFYDGDGKYILTHTMVKGEKPEEEEY